MIARGSVAVAAGDDGRSRLTCLRSEGPLVLRPAAGTLVHLVGGAGGPLGGDVLKLEIVVGPGADLTLRSVAASVAQPGPGPSMIEVDARVGEGGSLRWLPEPTVAAAGCRHESRARVVVAAGGRLLWREELIRGRHGEDGGSVSSRLSVDLSGRPLVRHQLGLGPDHPAWVSPAVGGEARCAGSLVMVDPGWAADPPGPIVLDGAAAALPLAGPAVHVIAVASAAITLRRLLDEGEASITSRHAGARRR